MILVVFAYVYVAQQSCEPNTSHQDTFHAFCIKYSQLPPSFLASFECNRNITVLKLVNIEVYEKVSSLAFQNKSIDTYLHVYICSIFETN